MSGETCPRCRQENGYPVPSTIGLDKKMVFVCRDCGHRWSKRNSSGGIPLKWVIYGIGFLIGIMFGVHRLFQGPIQSIIDNIKRLFG